jgi:endoglucanase
MQDIRTQNSSRVYIENNAGFQGALAALAEAPGTWEQCLQGYGVLTKDHTVCGKLD